MAGPIWLKFGMEDVLTQRMFHIKRIISVQPLGTPCMHYILLLLLGHSIRECNSQNCILFSEVHYN